MRLDISSFWLVFLLLASIVLGTEVGEPENATEAFKALIIRWEFSEALALYHADPEAIDLHCFKEIIQGRWPSLKLDRLMAEFQTVPTLALQVRRLQLCHLGITRPTGATLNFALGVKSPLCQNLQEALIQWDLLSGPFGSDIGGLIACEAVVSSDWNFVSGRWKFLFGLIFFRLMLNPLVIEGKFSDFVVVTVLITLLMELGDALKPKLPAMRFQIRDDSAINITSFHQS